MSPFGRLQRAFGATAVDALAPPIVGGIDDAIRAQSVCNFRQSIPLQGHIIDTAHYISGFRVNHPKLGIVRVFDIPVGRLGQRDARGSFHLIDDFPLFRDVFRIPLVHDIAEWGKFVVPLVTVHTVRNSNQAHIVLREKFLRQPTDLYVVTAQPGQVFDKNRGDIPGFDGGYHFLKARALHSSACNTIIHEK